MTILILIADVVSALKVKTVSSAPSALPSCRSLMATCWHIGVRNETSETWPNNYPIFGAVILVAPVPDIVPVAARLVSSSI